MRSALPKCTMAMHSQASPGVRRTGPTRASPAFNFSQLSVRLLSVPFPFMYSKFPLPAGRTEKRPHPSPARPPQLERGREGGGVVDDGASAPLFAGDVWGKGQTVKGGGFAALVQFFGEIFYAYFPFDSMQTLWARVKTWI